jgi:hypothetical protein
LAAGDTGFRAARIDVIDMVGLGVVDGEVTCLLKHVFKLVDQMAG